MKQRLEAFYNLRIFLENFLNGRKNPAFAKDAEALDKLIDTAFSYNGWFTRENILKALAGICFMLEEKQLEEFSQQITEPAKPKTVAVIMAGNIPAVGFHDLLCVLLSGNKILIKQSTDDALLISFMVGYLLKHTSVFNDQIAFSDGKLRDFDAIIATGSNSSALYFEKYFGKYPHIIRKNRTSVGVLSGKESREELSALGYDIFDYFGLGCRNVSKLYVPEGYKFDALFESVFSFGDVINNKKYANNHEYNRAIYLLNNEKFLDNNFLMIRNSDKLHSPISVLFYEEYKTREEVIEKIKGIESELQCIVSGITLPFKTTRFGQTQKPAVFDFSDDINTLEFLNNLG